MKHFFAIAALMGGLLASTAASACQFDTDGKPRSQCDKTGGVQPGNDHDRKPVYSPLDPNRTTGNACQFDLNCGPGSQWVKQSGIYGVFVRR